MRWTLPLAFALLAPASALATPKEDEVLRLYHDGQHLTARRLDEELLAEDPNSVVGHYVLGAIARETEGNLPLALRELIRARELYEERYGTTPSGDWKLHQEILLQIALISREIGQYEYELQILDYYDALYSPDLPGEHVWPLMKLGRFEEARMKAQEAIRTDDPFEKRLGHNGLCALESEAANRAEAASACLLALEFVQRDKEGDVTVAAFNAALGQLGNLEFASAEKIAADASTHPAVTTANPWQILAPLYLAEGRGELAVAAVRDMQRWRALQPPQLRDQNRAETDAIVATLLLAAGETTRGLELISRSLEYPDRRGVTSKTPEQALGGHALVRLALRSVDAERAAETRATKGLGARASGWLASFGPDPASWQDRATVVSVMTDEDRLHDTLRVYLPGGLDDVPVWLLGDLVDALGAGVVHEALQTVREQEEDPRFVPYYDAIEAEIRLARGDRHEALALAETAYEALPEEEVLLKARVAAVAGKASWDAGDAAAGMGWYESAFTADPGTLRRMHVALPAAIETTSSTPAARAAVKMLARSPRFDLQSGGFTVLVGEVDPMEVPPPPASAGEPPREALTACLLSPTGAQLRCVPVPLPTDEADDGTLTFTAQTDWEYAQTVVDTFHRRAFSIALGAVSTQRAGSLDGSTIVKTDAARERMEALLDGLAKPPPPPPPDPAAAPTPP